MMNNILIDNNEVMIGYVGEYVEDACSQALDMIREMDTEEIESLAELREQAYEYAWEYADNLVPIYTWNIKEEFGKLSSWEVDDLACNYDVEYNGKDFERFQMAILFGKYYQELEEELQELFGELVENNKEELKEEAKSTLESAYNEELEDLLIENGFYLDNELFNSIFEDGRLLTAEARAYIQLHYDNYLY